MIISFRFTSLIAVILLTVASLGAKPRTNAADIKELNRLEVVWNNAHLKGDTSTVDKLWADDLFVTAPDMPPMNKEESLAMWKAGKMKFDVYRTSDLRIKIYGNTAVVTGQLVRIRDATSDKFEDDWRFTKVYVRRNGRWQVVTWHGSHVGTS
jgi:ketosteroid isomerase-like protein